MTSSREVQEAAGLEGETLEAKAERLRATVADQQAPAMELTQVEQQIAERDAAQFKAHAQERLLGIVRAAGSLNAALEQDEVRVLQTQEAANKAKTMLNERCDKLAALRREARALADRFGLEAPAIEAPVPATLPVLRELEGVDLHGTLYAGEMIREMCTRDGVELHRRTYEEIAGSPGYEIVQAAGLKPWPVPTPEQRRVAAFVRGSEARIGGWKA